MGQAVTSNEISEFIDLMPKGYSLSQNYPNPFNPTTKIKFSIPISGNVKIIIFDPLGKEIQILLNEYKSIGSYEIDFNSSLLSSGIYFYQLISGKYSKTKKMIILK